jgi:YD repeat-containing protein
MRVARCWLVARSQVACGWLEGRGYRYDSVGSLTNIVYPVSSNISLAYDGLNRLTNMVDAVGTTTYGYDAAGQILSEDGRWADDTVSYTYNNRMRARVSVAAPNASAWTQNYDNAGQLLTAIGKESNKQEQVSLITQGRAQTFRANGSVGP